MTEKSLTAVGFTLTAADTAVTALTEATHTAAVGGGLTGGTDYSLAIAAPAGVTNHLSITNGGTITIGSAIEVTQAGIYTVTAAGKGNYSGTVSDSFTLRVNRKDITTIPAFNVSASNKAATARTSETYQGGTMGGSLEFGTDYGLAITTKAGGAANFFSVDSVDSSGAIMFSIISGIALNDAGTYTITAAGMVGSNYTGSVSDDFQLTVTPKSLSDFGAAVFGVSVDDKAAAALTGDSHSATITNTGTPSLAVNTDYSLAIIAPAGVTNHLSIDDNGTIIIDPAIDIGHGGTYTVTAAGMGNYTGSVSDTFFLTVTEKSLTAAGFTLTAADTAVTALTEATHTAAGRRRPEGGNRLRLDHYWTWRSLRRRQH